MHVQLAVYLIVIVAVVVVVVFVCLFYVSTDFFKFVIRAFVVCMSIREDDEEQ